MKKVLIFLISFLLFYSLQADISLKIRVFSQQNIQNIDIEILSGKYQLLDSTGQIICDLEKNEILKIRTYGKLMLLIKEKDTLGIEEKISLKACGFLNILQLKPIKPSINARIYDDDIIIATYENAFLKIINEVKLEHYVAGVIEAEAGIAKNEEFYKVQAVSTRTFALKNMYKHEEEGYHLCDATHCQVYRGRCSKTSIMIATSKTTGKIMIDNQGDLVSAVFHSNSGGQTANSEDVWSKPLPYLRSINDTFSIGQRSYYWSKSMEKQEWLNYLNNTYNYPINDPLAVKKVLQFSQPYRKAYLSKGIRLKKIRSDLSLRSTFFSIKEDGNMVVFTGRGFGHGVGMSQEGAIRMAKLGYSYDYILKFYYTGISIINLNEKNIFE